MKTESLNFEKYWYLITPSKLFYQICDEYQVSQKVMRRKLKKQKLNYWAAHLCRLINLIFMKHLVRPTHHQTMKIKFKILKGILCHLSLQ